MEQSDTNIEDLMRFVAAEAVSKYEESARPRVEEQIRVAVSQALSEAEEKTRLKFEKLEAALAQEKEARPVTDNAEATGSNLRNDEDKAPRNLVVCIDGTANQFGVKARV